MHLAHPEPERLLGDQLQLTTHVQRAALRAPSLRIRASICGSCLQLISWGREPLLHFLILGAVLFGLHAMWGGDVVVERPGVIRVDAGVRARLAADHERRAGAPPSDEELAAAVDGWVRDEVLRREARALGLDRGDLVVERRLAQKMGFLLRSEADPEEPTDADLQALLDADPDLFRRPGDYVFEHRFFRADRADAEGDARAALTTDEPGDPFIHGSKIQGDRAAVDAKLGPGFVDALDALDTPLSGPISSAYGVHLVRMLQRSSSTRATLETHRDPLARRWLDERRDALQAERVARLVDRYTVEQAR